MKVNEFSDPALQIEKKQFYSLGCGACLNNIRARDKNRFCCRLEIVVYPDATAKTCRHWKRKAK